MSDEMLFQVQKFAMLRLATDPNAVRKLNDAYAFAWSEDVYPAFCGAGWHPPFKDCFSISGGMVEDLNNRLVKSWESKDGLTFYDLEAEYGVRGLAAGGPQWGRIELVNACRYLFLKGFYDRPFWRRFLSHAPAEATSISDPFSISQIYFT